MLDRLRTNDASSVMQLSILVDFNPLGFAGLFVDSDYSPTRHYVPPVFVFENTPPVRVTIKYLNASKHKAMSPPLLTQPSLGDACCLIFA